MSSTRRGFLGGLVSLPGVLAAAQAPLRGGVIVAELPPGVDRGTFANSLYSKYGVAGAPVGGVRLAPHIYNTMDDVEKTVRAVRELLG